MAVTRRERDDPADEDEPTVAWHNQTSTLLGASVAGLAAIAVLIGLISYVAGQFTEPEPAPLYYVPPPSASTTSSGSATSTTTGTVTSTSPPMTSDINSDETTSSASESTSTPTTRPPRTREPSAENDGEDGEDGEPETTRSRPRTNVTRTLYPGT